HEGCGDSSPEQALRERKYQDQDSTRTRPQAHREDRAQAAPPAAGAGQFARQRTVGMPAMLVVHVAMVVIVVVSMIVSVAVVPMVMVRVPVSVDMIVMRDRHVRI